MAVGANFDMKVSTFGPNIGWPEDCLFCCCCSCFFSWSFSRQKWLLLLQVSSLPFSSPSPLPPPSPSRPVHFHRISHTLRGSDDKDDPTEISLSLESFDESQLLLSQLMGGPGWPTWKAAKWMHNREVTSQETPGVFIKENEEMKRRVQSSRRCRDVRRTWSSLPIIMWS